MMHPAMTSLITLFFALSAVTSAAVTFSGGTAPQTLSNGDADGNLYLTVSDAVTLLRYLLLGGSEPLCP